MYFAVFLLEVKKLVVLPPHWIKDGDKVWEKFVNHGGVHTNQKYLCYYQRKDGEFNEDDGADFAFAPDFSTTLATRYPSAARAACYYCKIVRYFYGKRKPFDISFQTNVL